VPYDLMIYLLTYLLTYWTLCTVRIWRITWNKLVKWLTQMHTKTIRMKG